MRPTERPYNTSVFILRALQAGLRLDDLNAMETGEVTDIVIESNNDHENYRQLATQADFDKF